MQDAAVLHVPAVLPSLFLLFAAGRCGQADNKHPPLIGEASRGGTCQGISLDT